MNLREAAERALDALEDIFGKEKKDVGAINALRQALAQPEQEPVCFLRETSWSYEIAPWDDPNGIPVYTTPPEREYVTEVVAMHENGTRTIKQTLIQNRKWAGLTADEVYVCWKSGDVVAAVEAKLKEKNGG